MQVAVVGGGVFGACLAYRLAVRGHTVAILEKHAFGHAGSASGDKSRIVRALYAEPAFAAAGHASLDLWSAWAAELEAPIVERVGVLYLDDAGDAPNTLAFRAWLDQGIANVKRLGGAIDEIDAAEVHKRYPALDTSGLRRGVLEVGGGFGRAALATSTLARAAFATGRVEHLPVRATSILSHAGAATGVAFSGGSLEAEFVIVAAGFEGAELVAPFAGDLGIRRVPHWTSYFRIDGLGAARALSAPAMPCWADLGNHLYGIPLEGESGFKVAWHEPRRVGRDSDVKGEPTFAQIEELRRAASRRFPVLANASCIESFACAYDATPDETFRIGPVPGTERLIFVGGLSGHGFKHAPAIAESLAALVSGEEPLLDLAPHALARG